MAVRGFPVSLSRGMAATLRTVLRQESPRHAWEVSVAAVPALMMRQVNLRYRRRKYIANVLSFLLDPPTRDAPGRGEILVCIAQVKRDAAMYGLPWQVHLHRMLVHSCLHVLGHSHDTAHAWKEMERREKKYK